MNYVIELSHVKGEAPIGGKAAHLRFLQQQGAAVPRTYVCTWQAFVDAAVNEEAVVLAKLRRELGAVVGDGRSYAVRSSANVEDSSDFSFAGQFDTVLNVSGLDGVLDAVTQVWASARRETLRPYLQQTGLSANALKMAVMVQEMVQPVISGVVFSKNPLTGMDEVIVEAVRGSGERLVQEGVTPTRWVYKWGDWIAQPQASDMPLSLAQSVVTQTQTLARAFGAPVDLEWVYDGETVHWVQIRPISTLSNINIYSNRISREVLPGIIKPLVWSVNVPLVNSAWIDLFTELIGRNDIAPDQLSKAFHYRAYFNMGVIGEIFTLLGMPRETLELMMGIDKGGSERPSFRPSPKTLRHLPRMVRFGLDKARFARRVEAFLPTMRARYQPFAADSLQQLDELTLLARIDQLFEMTVETAYFNIVTPLLMQFHNAMLKRRLAALDVAFDEFDLTRGLDAELRRTDPNRHLGALQAQYRTQHEEAGEAAFQADLAHFVDQFGHLSDSGNDFSAVPWRESPELVLHMIEQHIEPEKGAQRKLTVDDLPLSGLARWRLRRLVRRAQQFLLYREAVGFLYTYGYGLFRNHFLALGDHFVRRSVLGERKDIFYLYLDEVRQLVNGTVLDAAALVAARKAEIEACRDAVLPDIIYGDDAPPLETAVSLGQTMQGTPTSRGYYKGPVRVIQGSHDFHKMREGDVLVIPFSDVGWTPLFTKAGAVIAESGGMLSHSSIVAREYHIPAVVSVTDACRLPDDVLVSVDGYQGEIVVHTKDGGQ